MIKIWDEKKQLLSKKYQDIFGVRPLEQSQIDIVRWFDSELGQRVLQQQQNQLNELLAQLFGYHLMQLSVLDQATLYSQSPTSHQFTLTTGLDKERSCSAQSSFEQLPIDSDVIDVAVLHHVLDFSPNPHQLLREVTRTLIPNGHIVLVGFNPFGMMRVINPLACVLSKSLFYRRHHLRIGRLRDWCKVLELDVLYTAKGYHNLPFNFGYSKAFEKIGQRLLPFSGQFYIMVVRKNITPMTMIQTKWKKKKVLPKWREGVVSTSAGHSSSTNVKNVAKNRYENR